MLPLIAITCELKGNTETVAVEPVQQPKLVPKRPFSGPLSNCLPNTYLQVSVKQKEHPSEAAYGTFSAIICTALILDRARQAGGASLEERDLPGRSLLQGAMARAGRR